VYVVYVFTYFFVVNLQVRKTCPKWNLTQVVHAPLFFFLVPSSLHWLHIPIYRSNSRERCATQS